MSSNVTLKTRAQRRQEWGIGGGSANSTTAESTPSHVPIQNMPSNEQASGSFDGRDNGNAFSQSSVQHVTNHLPRPQKCVLIIHASNWCGYSIRQMDTVHDILPHLSGTGYEVFCVNVDESDSNKAMASRFGVSGYPNTLILGTSGKVLHHVKGYMESSKLGELSRRVIEHHGRNA